MNRAEWLAWKETDPDWVEREQRRAAKRARKLAWNRLYSKRPEVAKRRRAYDRERAAAARGGGE